MESSTKNLPVVDIEQLAVSGARHLAMAALKIVPACRQCGAPLSSRASVSFLSGKRVRCSQSTDCDWYGTWRDNTPLHRSTISDRQFVAMFYHFSLPEQSNLIADRLGISYNTVKEWRERIKAISIDEDAAA